MESKNSHQLTNFWFGFSLGITLTALLAYFFGTKKGRQLLHELLENTENLEEKILFLIEELEARSKSSSSSSKSLEKIKSSGRLENIIDKIKSISSEKKHIKQFFAKDGKIIHN